eukprot:gene12858-17233_t
MLTHHDAATEMAPQTGATSGQSAPRRKPKNRPDARSIMRNPPC